MAETEAQKKKRRLRAPTETVREKAAKAQEVSNAPAKRGATRSFFYGLSWPLRILFRGLGWLGHRPPLKQLGHALRWFFSLKPFRFLATILGFKFVGGSFREVRLVTWPGWKLSLRLTGAVIIFSAIFGGLIAVVDFGLNKLFKHIILK